MKNINILIALLIFISCSAQKSQKIENSMKNTTVVTYEETNNVDSQLSQIPDENLRAQIKSQLTKPAYFDLIFNENESNYEKSKSSDLKKDDDLGGQQKFQVITMNAQSTIYRNLKTNKYLKGTSLLGKDFLIEKEPKKIDWKLENEIKKIGDYNCNKAFATIDGNLVEAWYTNSIPFSGGPADYFGLPGLIIELKTNKKYYIATGIKENENFAVAIPAKGKKISEQEFEKLKMESLEDIKNGVFQK